MRAAPLLLGLCLLLTSQSADAASRRALFALVVGVNQSVDKELPRLRYADDDAARYFELFGALGARTYLVARLDEGSQRLHPQAAAEARPPTSRELKATIKRLRADVRRAKKRGLEPVLYFVYAGHGNVENNRGYITLEDERIFGPDLNTRVLKKVGASQNHLIVDACYSFFLAYGRGAGGNRRKLHGFGGLGTLADDPDLGLLLSTSSAAESHEWEAFQAGVFSHEVRSGLYGAADADGDGDVTYREIAAFIDRANGAVPNEKYRPRVHARPPQGRGLLVPLGTAPDRGIEIAGNLPGHWMLEDKVGVRLVDVHNKPGQTVRLVRPPRGLLYLRRLPDDVEYEIRPQAERTEVARLRGRTARVSGRGAAHHNFGKLFELDFGRDHVDDFEFPEPVLTMPEPPQEIRRATLKRLLSSGSSVAVLDLTPASPEAAEVASLATAAVAQGLAAQHDGPVLSTLDVEALLNKGAMDQMSGCSDDRCLVDISRALDVDEIVACRLGRHGDQVLVFLSRIDPAEAKVLARTSTSFSSLRELPRRMASASKKLLDPEALELGDEPVAALRTAVVVEEVSEEGAAPARNAVGACIKKQFLDAGTPLVSPVQVRRIKSRTRGLELLNLDPLDVVSEDEADVLLLATVDYGMLAEFEGIRSYEGVLSMQLVKVDTGEIVASDTKKARASGHSPRMAISQVGDLLCKEVRPALDEALQQKRARGTRIVLEVEGKMSPSELSALAARLKRLGPVARAQPRRARRGKAILDLVLSQGDGIGLVLQVPPEQMQSLGLEVVEASASRVVVRR